MKDAHPLHPALITLPPGVYAVDPLTERVYRRSQRERDRALPTGRAARQHPARRWGRSADAPRSTGAPVIMSPTDLLPGGGQADAPMPSFDDVIKRLKR